MLVSIARLCVECLDQFYFFNVGKHVVKVLRCFNDFTPDQIIIHVLNPIISPFQKYLTSGTILETLSQDHTFNSLFTMLFKRFTEPRQVFRDRLLMSQLCSFLFRTHKHII